MSKFKENKIITNNELEDFEYIYYDEIAKKVKNVKTNVKEGLKILKKFAYDFPVYIFTPTGK